jgi:hypothetical protein
MPQGVSRLRGYGHRVIRGRRGRARQRDRGKTCLLDGERNLGVIAACVPVQLTGGMLVRPVDPPAIA